MIKQIKNIGSKVTKTHVRIVLVILMLFIATSLISLYLYPIYDTVDVHGESMEPVISEGDLVIVEHVDSIDEVEVGDNIVFDSKGCNDNIILHKVVDETEDGLLTQGVNNDINDQEMKQVKIDGITQEITIESCIDPVNDDMIQSKVVFTESDSEFGNYISSYIDFHTSD